MAASVGRAKEKKLASSPQPPDKNACFMQRILNLPATPVNRKPILTVRFPASILIDPH
jgi:hypothetical protein